MEPTGRRSIARSPDASAVHGPESMLGRDLPDLRLGSSLGGEFALRSRVGLGPLVLFFYIHNGTPG
jgi:hypothetical protein